MKQPGTSICTIVVATLFATAASADYEPNERMQDTVLARLTMMAKGIVAPDPTHDGDDAGKVAHPGQQHDDDVTRVRTLDTVVKGPDGPRGSF